MALVELRPELEHGSQDKVRHFPVPIVRGANSWRILARNGVRSQSSFWFLLQPSAHASTVGSLRQVSENSR